MAELSLKSVPPLTANAPVRVAGKVTQTQLRVLVDVPLDKVVIGAALPVAELEPGDTADNDDFFSHEEVLGRTLDGRYHLRAPLGSGGMASVYLADDRLTGRDVAVKIMNPGTPLADSLFRDEVSGAVYALGLPNMLQVRGTGIDNASLSFPARYIVTEYLDKAITLSQLLKSKGGRLSLPETLEIVRSVCIGLEGLHDTGVVHRDLKPENIMLRHNAEGKLELVKVIDPGLAKPAAETVSPDGQLIGTPRYMSPEQLRNKQLTPSSDVFAVGVLSERMFSGDSPFADQMIGKVAMPQHRELPATAFEKYPALLRTLMPRLLALDPAARPQNAGALIGEIDAYLKAEESSFQSFNRAVAEGVAASAASGAPKAGTMIFFTGDEVTAGFEELVNVVFSPEEGYSVYPSRREGMEGVFVYTRADKADVMAQKGEFLAGGARQFNMTPVVAVVKESFRPGAETSPVGWGAGSFG